MPYLTHDRAELVRHLTRRRITRMSFFTLTIRLGNEAMRDTDDITAALQSVAAKVAKGQHDGTIMDTNGNRVGSWTLK